MDKLTLESLQVLYACRAAVSASNLIYSLQNSQFSTSYKADGSPVTTVDLESNRIICDLLNKTDIPIISEESEIPHWNVRSSWETFWVVDPIDGTTQYIQRGKNYSVLIALIHKGVPQLGIVSIPAWDKLYVGIPGKSLWMTSIKNFIDITSFQEVFPIIPGNTEYVLLQSSTQLSLEDRIFQRCLERKYSNLIVKKKAGIFKILDLIFGKAHLYARFSPLWIWDIAAGHALLQSVGWDLLDLQKNSLHYQKEDLLFYGFSSSNPTMLR